MRGDGGPGRKRFRPCEWMCMSVSLCALCNLVRNDRAQRSDTSCFCIQNCHFTSSTGICLHIRGKRTYYLLFRRENVCGPSPVTPGVTRKAVSYLWTRMSWTNCSRLRHTLSLSVRNGRPVFIHLLSLTHLYLLVRGIPGTRARLALNSWLVNSLNIIQQPAVCWAESNSSLLSHI